MFADLHLHTHFSDGTYGPEELASLAERHGLKAVALTDHDTMEGCARAAAACQERGIEFIPASELTAELGDVELHLIGYFLDSSNERLQKELGRFQRVRQQRIHEMASRLRHLGVPLQAESVFRLASCAAPGRPHVARALVQQGLCGSLDEAFERFLKKGKPAWVPKFKMSALDAIELIHQAGGVAVMAHPGLNRTDDVIPHLVKAGLDGLECFHTKHSTSMTEHYLGIAEQHKLLVTGGSDCHGISKGKPLIGTIRIPYIYVERLKDHFLKKSLERGFQIAGNSGAQT
ncbi:MAG: PHP domain-containing protein [Verrucomicrobia subdivision 3 bacterium]|nr:PHP domain-containing protein [Limisphaerales bacterium]